MTHYIKFLESISTYLPRSYDLKDEYLPKAQPTGGKELKYKFISALRVQTETSKAEL
jgi:hypothetical protein